MYPNHIEDNFELYVSGPCPLVVVTKNIGDSDAKVVLYPLYARNQPIENYGVK